MPFSIPAHPEDLLTESYDYDLPEAAIAQVPVHPRDHARLLVIHPHSHHHSYFYDLPHWLRSGDLLVVNNTRVIPARLFARKTSGSQIEILLLEQRSQDTWLALVKPGRRVHVGDTLQLDLGVAAQVLAHDPPTRGRLLRFHWPPDLDFWQLLEQLGELPLPPYITSRNSQPEDYQTIWATQPGSVAAPTAGLHFTPELQTRLEQSGIPMVSITLNIGLGTFRPVEVESIADHVMHREYLQVSPATVEKILKTKAQGGRVIAVGTTSARALESCAHYNQGQLVPWTGHSELFIYPGYRWQVIDGLITNFHLPKSTLLMMISSLVGRQRILALYQEALQHGYRFYSFGDGMLILPDTVQ
ncbi:MAG: tRNA preQ1(34) S-adenosylmethionine ribosyltransferase-isomerase QueA [Thermostichales cyanobacterium DRC_bins_46]